MRAAHHRRDESSSPRVRCQHLQPTACHLPRFSLAVTSLATTSSPIATSLA